MKVLDPANQAQSTLLEEALLAQDVPHLLLSELWTFIHQVVYRRELSALFVGPPILFQSATTDTRDLAYVRQRNFMTLKTSH